ncbi:DUF4381 domain-containing protein [Shewanella violacea]|uniref:DUF4381 domain-containing protein n=1 Tax=Shewanella violacea (strain JCM 10179 / CIP 106290 / LMG 19151 / DSS12) TaxID=637905 RepID=D4ZMI2_SHEVD|nr:DUF4381 domain-containing protein [Shewanella violacea]BAJ02881.1 conserved hypothetical protein [Shewanella violacea DSS12]
MQPTANPALTALKDIHTPEVISNMPIALGYWLVLTLILIGLTALIFKLKQARRHRAPKREVLSAVASLDTSSDKNSADIPVQINALIKRAAMSYLSREQIAGLEGDSWHQWMARQVKRSNPRLKALLDRRYQREGLTQNEAEELKTLATNWLKQALPLQKDLQNISTSNKEAQC